YWESRKDPEQELRKLVILHQSQNIEDEINRLRASLSDSCDEDKQEIWQGKLKDLKTRWRDLKAWIEDNWQERSR
ncbi:MAG: hypothetical protein ACRC77_02830, partial [Bacteroidales bacterium]